MAIGVVLDTSFLITLADRSRAYHQAARSYWKHFTESGQPLFLPTIVVSEFCIHQAIPAEILRACVVLPFNWDDALIAAALDFSKVDRENESRAALKDDIKIIGQAIVKEAAWIITDDAKTLYKFAKKLNAEGRAPFRPIKLADGFDPSLFNPAGQHELDYDAGADDEDAGE